MPSTTGKGYPYPEGTDPVADGDDAIQALAQAIDDRLPAAMAWGSVQLTGVTVGNKGSAAVTFPAGGFGQTPFVTTGLNSTVPAERFTSHGSKSTTSMTIFGGYTGLSTEINMVINWVAVSHVAPPNTLQLAGDTPPGPPAGVDDDATATCPTAGCTNQGIPIPIESTWTDEDTGETHPVDVVVCGVCGTDITSTQAPIGE